MSTPHTTSRSGGASLAAPAPDDLLDQLVAEYSERLARGGDSDGRELLARAPAEHRSSLQRCFRMLQAGHASAPRRAATLAPGDTLERFRIVREIGRGGMAVVYLAVQLDLQRQVALKVLRPGLALEGRNVDRFRREALAVARLQHPHIVAVHAVGEADGFHYLAMELVEGRSLADVFAALPQDRPRTAQDLAAVTGLPPAAVQGRSFEQAFCALLAPVARALAVAHEVGLVHRDVKPSNILVHKDGRAVIADFGLAKGDGDPGLSLTGEPLGTPYYMSPEQAAASEARVDQRTDVYSLGVTLFEGLSGRRPFEGETVMAVLAAVRERQAPSLRSLARACTREAEAVTRRAMARRPEERYASALEFAVDLAALAEGRGTQAALREGGPLRRAWTTARGLLRGEIKEYRSGTTLLGLPLVHVVMCRRRGGLAKGWFAYGERALGVVALGGMTCGVISLGGMSVGVLSFAGLSCGVVALGGMAAGWLALGGVAAGWAAVGGMAWGHYVMAGKAVGVHVITNAFQDPVAIEWFRSWLWLIELFPGMKVLRRFF